MKTALSVLFIVLIALPTTARAKIQRFVVNGIPVRLVEKHDFNYVTVSVVVRTGALSDPVGKAGLAGVTARMLLRGTSKLTRAQISEQIDYLGSRLSNSAGYRSIKLSGDALSRNLKPFMEILSQLIREPSFPKPELSKQIRLLKARILARRESDRSLAGYYFRRFLLQGHPLGRSTAGTLKSLSKISRKDVVEFHRTHFVRNNLILGFTGKLNRKQATALVKRYFGTLKRGKPNRPTFVAPRAPKKISLLFIDKPKRTQTQVYVGHLGLKATSRHYFPLVVANTIFGGTFTARLMHEIREKRGWSYGAYSYNRTGRETGLYYFRFYPATKDTVPALKLALSLYRKLIADGLSARELEFAKSYIKNSFQFKLDTPIKQLSEAIRIDLLGLPKGHLKSYLKRIRNVDAKTLNKTLKAVLSPDNLVIVIVGTWSRLKPALMKLEGINRILVNRYDTEWDPKKVPQGPTR